MDVTSLLNTGSARLEHRTSMDQAHTPLAMDGSTPASTPFVTPSPEKTPSRHDSESRVRISSRTPWDAGGYSLPLSLDTKSFQASTKPSLYFSESPIEPPLAESPRSPRHKWSDSQSSLSSYASSTTSVSHSRISSLSTVGEFQPMNSTLLDTSERIMDAVPGAPCAPTLVEISPPSPVLEESPSRSSSDDESHVWSDHGSAETMQRPQSPSDAILITRFPGSERRESQESVSTIFSATNNSENFLSPDYLQMKSHKRALSAPDFSILGSTPFSEEKQMAEVIDEQQDLSRSSSRAIAASGTPNLTPAQNVVTTLEARADQAEASAKQDWPENDPPPFPPGVQPECMFGNSPCKTESTLRKAISHIFGRNKLVTRSIPDEVWVHYCRKHYQRCRYRDIQGWAVKSADLVLLQIEHVERWSSWNTRHNKELGVVTGWTLTLRKREIARISKMNGKKRPREDDEDLAFYDPSETADFTGTAVPDWLLQESDKDLTTSEIQVIVKRIRQDIVDQKLSQIPDIEILPQIDTTKTVKHRNIVARTPRRNGGTAHKRSQSLAHPPSHASHHIEKRPRMDFTHGTRIGHDYGFTYSNAGNYASFPPSDYSLQAPQDDYMTPSMSRMGTYPVEQTPNIPFYNSGTFDAPRRVMSHQRSHSEIPYSHKNGGYTGVSATSMQLPSINDTAFGGSHSGYSYSRQPETTCNLSAGSYYQQPQQPRPSAEYLRSPPSFYTPASAAQGGPYNYPASTYPQTSAPNSTHLRSETQPLPAVSDTMRPSFDDSRAHTQSLACQPPRHVRQHSTPAVNRMSSVTYQPISTQDVGSASTYQPASTRGIDVNSTITLPYHPSGPWSQSASSHPRPLLEQPSYSAYHMVETERDHSTSGPRFN